MFWADQVADNIERRFQKEIKDGVILRIRDEKTLSGRVHVGSLRGIAIHGIISEVLTERGIANEYLFELNDIDPMDGLPKYLDEATFRPHMGKPLYAVPSPDDTASSLPEWVGKEFLTAVEKTGFKPTYYHIRDVYRSGAFNEAIRIALEQAEEIRRIYKEVSGSEKPDDWLPLQVICEECGKIGTTKVTSFDGTKVHYRCEPALVTWAVGCGHEGDMEPWNANAKLPWKVEWAAKFAYLPRPINSNVPYGVDIEGAGKDHATKGGARDIADHICAALFKHPAPFDIPYNFFVVGGKKMGSSTATGTFAIDLANLLPTEVLRLLMIRKHPKHEIDFIPDGNTIPNLYDEYDRIADSYFDPAHPRDDDPVRFYYFSQLSGSRKTKNEKLKTDFFRPRFSTVSFMVQMPHLDVLKEVTDMKGGALTETDKHIVDERVAYAHRWLDTCVPDDYKFVLQEKLPASAKDLTATQKKVLSEIHTFLTANPETSGENIHACLHKIKENTGANPKEVFEAIYRIFLGKTSGPQAGWFLKALDRTFVLTRLEEASKNLSGIF